MTRQPAVLDACLCLCVGYPEAGGTGSEELPDVAAGAQVLSKDSIFFSAPRLVFEDYQSCVGVQHGRLRQEYPDQRGEWSVIMSQITAPPQQKP